MRSTDNATTNTALVLGVAVGLLVGAALLAALGGGVSAGEVPTPLGPDGAEVAVPVGGAGDADVSGDSMDATSDSASPGATGAGDQTAGDTPHTPGGTSGTGTQQGGDDAGDTDAEPDTDPNTDPDTDPDPGTDPDTATVRILWWNDTADKPVLAFRVSIGDSSWSPPDPSARSAEGSLTGLEPDTPYTMVLLPDGAAGTRIEVPILFASGMASDSERDAIHIEIGDGTVRVLGNPVENVDVTYNRF